MSSGQLPWDYETYLSMVAVAENMQAGNSLAYGLLDQRYNAFSG